jgi:multiple sugar transport system substrate-binding protein
MKRRHFLAAAAIVTTSLFSVAARAEDVNLTWQMWGDAKDTALWTQLADLVHKKYPNITVTPQILGWSDYWTRLPVMAASGQAADIVAMQSLRMPAFYSLLEPLDERFAAAKFDVKEFEPSIISALSYDKKIYALPYDVGPFLVFYNKDAFAKAGIAEPKPGWTMDEFTAAAKALTDADHVGYAPQVGDFETMAPAQGVELVGDDGKLDLTNPKLVDVVTKLTDMASKDKSAAPPVGAAGLTASGRFASGNAAMYIDGPWSLINTQGQVKFKVGVATQPRGAGDLRAPTAGSGFGISTSSKHKDEAYKALEVLTGPEALTILAAASRALPGRTAQQSVRYNVAAKDITGTKESLEYAFAHSVPYRLTDNWNAVENAIIQYMPLAYSGKATTAETLANIAGQVN